LRESNDTFKKHPAKNSPSRQHTQFVTTGSLCINSN